MTLQLEFTPEILDELNYERYRHLLPLVQRRMEALWLKSHGLPHGQIAQLNEELRSKLRSITPRSSPWAETKQASEHQPMRKK